MREIDRNKIYIFPSLSGDSAQWMSKSIKYPSLIRLPMRLPGLLLRLLRVVSGGRGVWGHGSLHNKNPHNYEHSVNYNSPWFPPSSPPPSQRSRWLQRLRSSRRSARSQSHIYLQSNKTHLGFLYHLGCGFILHLLSNFGGCSDVGSDGGLHNINRQK